MSAEPLEIPALCLVVLVGISGAGKSSFARRHFAATEVVSSDVCRGLVSDDEGDQAATVDAFDVLRYIVGKRLARGRLTVVDATNVQQEARKRMIQLAREHDCLAVAIVLDVSTKLAGARNDARPDRPFGRHVLRQQAAHLRRHLRSMKREGFSRVHVLRGPEEIDAVELVRRPLWSDRRGERGPFDIIGDIHGCADELRALLGQLGYQLAGTREEPQVTPPPGRKAIFVGDLVDRGPDSPAALRLVMGMVAAGTALCVCGNHEAKLLRYLQRGKAKLTHGLAETAAQLAREPDEFRDQVATFIDGLISHYVLDDGRLVVAHAGLIEAYQGRASGRVRSFCLYGQTTGETDEYGLPVRHDWAAQYRGRATVVYGHTPIPEARWLNRTLCVDTGCVFGGKLTALRYPERELVQVDAARVYYEPTRPLGHAPAVASRQDDVLDLADVTGKRIVDTRAGPSVTIPEENAAAALEVMSRFAVDPRWLVYLPPTMSPTETAPAEAGLLERPQEAFDYYARNGVTTVVCEAKHMGSRAVLVFGRDAAAIERRLRVGDGKQGVVYTRTGRPFFTDPSLEAELIARVAKAFGAAGLWETLDTDWACLDAELMPWSLKAAELVRTQYASVSAAAQASLTAAVEALAAARERGAEELRARYQARLDDVDRYAAAWRRYCAEASRVDDLRLAPFHVLATDAATHVDRSHVWHMDTLARLADHDPVLVATPYQLVELEDEESRAAGVRFWEALTDAGGEGVVVKPEDWLAKKDGRSLLQPALKCRGREYLRIIYGPEYTAPE
ncbi:MAG: polynucleotide kinase-phosphatase, partial [Myxococcales bacterium]|nr:polynucleotide kinase-phosphatase [Myxococcales bacterium]